MDGNWAKILIKIETNFYLPIYFGYFDTWNVFVNVKMNDKQKTCWRISYDNRYKNVQN